jgi:hypothetical protein
LGEVPALPGPDIGDDADEAELLPSADDAAITAYTVGVCCVILLEDTLRRHSP